MNVRLMMLIAAPLLLAAQTAFAGAPAFDYGARRGPALGRVSPAPSIYSRHSPQAVAPRYYGGGRTARVCRIRTVRERYGDRIVERRYQICRERW